MTTPDTAEAPRARRALTWAEYGAEAARRFGPDPLDWAFKCPGCGDVATGREFPAGLAEQVGQDCIGRHRAALEIPAGRGCTRCAYGLVPGPWLVRLPSGPVVGSFPLADGPRAALSAVREPGVPGGPADATEPPAAPWTPARGLTVERAERPDDRQGYMLPPAPEEWDYRVALGSHLPGGEHAVVGYREPHHKIMLALADDDGLWLELTDDLDPAFACIANTAAPFSPSDVVTAVSLIVQAHGEQLAATAPPSLDIAPEAPGAYWSVENGWTDEPWINCSCHISAPCRQCESLEICGKCPTEVFVLADEMQYHLDAVHPDPDEPRPFVHDA